MTSATPRKITTNKSNGAKSAAVTRLRKTWARKAAKREARS